MNLLFRTEASRNEKIFTLFFYASIAAFFYGVYTSISPSDLVKENINIITPILASIYFIPLLLDQHPNNKIPKSPIPKRFLYYSLLFIFAYAVAFFLVAYSIPSIFTHLNGQPYSFSTIIENKDRSTKGCKYELKLKNFGYGMHDRVCVKSSFWEQANPGDEVQVHALKSALGIKVTAVEHKR